MANRDRNLLFGLGLAALVGGALFARPVRRHRLRQMLGDPGGPGDGFPGILIPVRARTNQGDVMVSVFDLNLYYFEPQCRLTWRLREGTNNNWKLQANSIVFADRAAPFRDATVGEDGRELTLIADNPDDAQRYKYTITLFHRRTAGRTILSDPTVTNRPGPSFHQVA